MTTALDAPASNWSTRARSAFPAGSNGEFNLPDELITVIASGHGCDLIAADGRPFLDFSMGWGSALPGHAHPDIIAAVQSAITTGGNFACVNEHSLQLAEQLIEISPAAQRVRFCASGTEATMYCLRLARAFTNKHKVVRFEGAYHGGNDIGTVSLFPAQLKDFPTPEPTSAGVDRTAVEDTLIAPFNDLATTTRILEQHAHQIAAVIVEPFHRCIAPAQGFLQGLRDACTDLGILLIFDEVVTGFRLALGGAQERYRVIPDLVAYGKALGGGLPIGAFAGRADILDLAREDRMHKDTYVWTASTLGGNPVSCAAALAAIKLYQQPGTYEQLFALGEHLRTSMRQALRETDTPATIIGDGPLAQVVFTDQPVTDYRSTRKGDAQRARRVMLELFRSGIFLNPMGTKLYLSLAHTPDTIITFTRHFTHALKATL